MERHRHKPDRSGAVARIAPSRIRLSDHQEHLPGVDGRTLLARRWQDIAANLIADQGGLDHVSTAKLHLCKRLAAIVSMVEEIEAKHVRGERIDMDAYLSMVNTATRLSNTIGLNRRSKTVPDLDEYRKGKRPQVIEHSEDDDD